MIAWIQIVIFDFKLKKYIDNSKRACYNELKALSEIKPKKEICL